jgi:hypothetical protein
MLGLRSWELYVLLLDRGSSTSFSTVYPISFLRTCGLCGLGIVPYACYS